MAGIILAVAQDYHDSRHPLVLGQPVVHRPRVPVVVGATVGATVVGAGVALDAVARADQAFESHSIAWQTATVFFAVLDLVAAVGLWLAAAWGAVVWLTSVVSMAAVELFFPNVYGGSIFVILVELTLLGMYLYLAIMSAREHA